MDILDEEILELWRKLYEHEVLYIMVGGFATNLNGFQRMTADLDIWLKDTIENRKKLGVVLKELELGDFENIENMQFVPGWSSIFLKSGFELDIMTSLKGFEKESSFDECFEMAPTAFVYDIPIKFLHINHLLQSKKATNRNKDKIDIEELEKLKTERNENSNE